MTLKIDVDFREKLGAVRHQGRRPTCLSFAASDAHQYMRNHPLPFCVEWLHYHAAQWAGNGTGRNTAIAFQHACSVLHVIGQPEEAYWPYSGQWSTTESWQPPSNMPRLWKCISSKCYASMDLIRAQINQFVPVVIGLYISDAFHIQQDWIWSDLNVVLGMDLGHGIEKRRSHAVVIVGYGSFSGEPVMLIRNSWGPEWGSDGYAWVREAYLWQRIYYGFIISSLMENR